METILHIEAGARQVKIYDLSSLEAETLDTTGYNLEEREDLLRFIDEIDALSESGELELLEGSVTVTGIDPDTIEEMSLSHGEAEEEKPVESDRLILNNLSPFAPLTLFEAAKPGTIFYLRSEEGRGIWDLRAELSESDDEERIEMGYFDCSGELDGYALLRESYLDYLCDTLIPERCRIGGVATETDRFDFEPMRIEGALYHVVTDPDSGLSSLERLPCPSRIFLDLFGEEE